MELPVNEAERLATLVRYGILDTEAEESFNRVTRLAAHIFDVPIALISLVDGYRQWFKASVGLSVRETPREISFCTHAILGHDVFDIPDAGQDERFRANPLVSGDPFVRCYAGAPLVTPDGFALGTMCVIDRMPRQRLGPDQARALRDLAGIVMDLLEGRRLMRAGTLAGRS